MSIFDIFTGKPAKQAAEQTRQYLTGVQNTGNAAVDNAFNVGQGAVTTGANAARGDLTTGYGDASNAVTAGGNNAQGYLDQGYGDAMNRSGASSTAALAAFDPLKALAAKYGGATSMALNAYGVNGQGGTDAARDAFKAGPAYNFNLDQGLDAINRRRAAGGMLDSGNADRDAQNYGAGLASNEYDKWLTGLNGFVNPELGAASGAASGAAGVLNSQAARDSALAAARGTAQSGVAQQTGTTLGQLAANQGTGLAGVDTGQGNTLAQLAANSAGQKVGLAGAVMQPYANTYGQEAAAQMGGSANLWGLGMNLAKLGVGSFGSGGGGGSSGAFGMGSGKNNPNGNAFDLMGANSATMFG